MLISILTFKDRESSKCSRQKYPQCCPANYFLCYNICLFCFLSLFLSAVYPSSFFRSFFLSLFLLSFFFSYSFCSSLSLPPCVLPLIVLSVSLSISLSFNILPFSEHICFSSFYIFLSFCSLFGILSFRLSSFIAIWVLIIQFCHLSINTLNHLCDVIV